jgi:hypothetical protein
MPKQFRHSFLSRNENQTSASGSTPGRARRRCRPETFSESPAVVVHLVKGGLLMQLPKLDISNYPPYDQVIPPAPTTDKPGPITFDVRYLAAIEEVNREHPDSDGRAVRCAAWGDRSSPMLFEGCCP